jgi:hypothetical protein
MKRILLSYLKLASKPKGLLINFHTINITSQVVSLVTEKFLFVSERIIFFLSAS